MTRKRNWIAVVYPDSLPDNWLDILTETGLPIAISPLHCFDINSDGEIKKPHYHLILCYSGPTSFEVVSDLIVSKLNGVIPKPCESVRGAIRYLTHLDNPEKYQYSLTDIRYLNGFDKSDYLTTTEVNSYIREIQNFIIDNNIVEFCDLLDILSDNEYTDWYSTVNTHIFLFNTYLTSRRNKQKILLT